MSCETSSITKSEKTVLIFNNSLLFVSILSAVAWWCSWRVNGQSDVSMDIAGAIGEPLLSGCVWLLFPCLIGAVYALIKARPENRERVWTLALVPFAAAFLVPVSVWIFLAFSYEGRLALALVSGLMGVIAIVSDILYPKISFVQKH